MAAMDSEVGFSECLQGFQVQNAMDAVAVSVSATEGFSRANFNRPHCSGRYESCRCNGKVRWVRSPSEGEYKPPPLSRVCKEGCRLFFDGPTVLSAVNYEGQGTGMAECFLEILS